MADSLPEGFALDDGTDSLPQGFALDEEKYGQGLINPVKAALLGAARGLTFSASDYALTKSGLVSPQTIEGLEEQNPLSSFGGEAAGTIAGLAIPVGPAALAAKAGKGVATAVKGAGIAGKLAKSGTTAAKILGAAESIGATAAGSAIEGALYAGVSESLHEAALGDPDLNGEKILENFGHGALMGGVLGGAVKGLELGLPPAVNAAKEGMVKLRDVLIGAGEGQGSGLVGKALPEKLSSALKNRGLNTTADAQQELVRDITSKFDEVHKNVATSIKTLNSDIRPLETKALIDTVENPQLVLEARQDLVNKLNAATDMMKAEPAIYSKSIARELEMLRDTVVDRMKTDKTPAQIFETLREMKQNFGDTIFASKIPTREEAKAIALLRPVSMDLDKVLKNPDVFGMAGSSLAAHDEILSKYYKFISPNGKQTPFTRAFMKKVGNKFEFDKVKMERVLKTAEKIQGQEKIQLLEDFYEVLDGLPEHLENTYASVPNRASGSEKLAHILENSKSTFDESAVKYSEIAADIKARGSGDLGFRDMIGLGLGATHPVLGAAAMAYNIAHKPLAYASKLAELERVIGRTTNMVNKGAKAIFDPSVDALSKSTGLITRQLVHSDHDNEETLEKFKKISQLSSDPAAMVDALHNATRSIHDAAPNTAQGAQGAMIRATQFLASKIPEPPNTNPFSAPYHPSKAELAKFARYADIVEKPTLALKQLQSNSLTPETLETLNAVYPKLYTSMKQTVLSEAMSRIAKKKPIPFQTKQSISMFLGQPLDAASNPIVIQQYQGIFKANPDPMNQPIKPTQTGMSKITLGERTKLGGSHIGD